MKRLSLYLFLVLFTLQTPSLADDIRDFQIEGISIGDSLLDYFSEEEINEKKGYYPSKKYFKVSLIPPNSNLFERVQFHIKSNDDKYIIDSISGLIFFTEKKNGLNACLKTREKILEEISSTLSSTTKSKPEIKKLEQDKTGNSTTNTIYFDFSSGDYIKIGCVIYGTEYYELKGWFDHLRLAFIIKEFDYWLRHEAFK